MNSQDNRDWQRRLEEIEQEINQTSKTSSANQTEPVKTEVDIEIRQKIEMWLNNLKEWFSVLPTVGKIAVGGLGAIAALSVFGAVLKIVSSLVSIAIMSVVLYFAYKFFIASSSEK
jgi:hypothetical protein